MKNKKVTYVLILGVIIIWGLIGYRVFEALHNDDDSISPPPTNAVKEVYNDYQINKDTTHLLLNYRDPFGLVKYKVTIKTEVKNRFHVSIDGTVRPPLNWNFIQYAGYIRNPSTRKLIAFVSINGKNETLAEGETKEQVKLIRNMRDSIKVSFDGQIKFIPIKSTL